MEEISKSQRKREADALQKLGVKLVELPADILDQLPLNEALRQAIDAAKSIRSHGAVRRQAQLIGKLMRGADHEAIKEAYEALESEKNAQTAAFHELEEWRDRLINDGKEALTEFIDYYQPADVQQLRQLIKKAVDERRANQSHGAYKALFRFIRASVEGPK
ncbi:alpha helix protein [Legionella birminghamensis]|uniref:Dual-action ribosomal maturation protein DarP n=1 Tax=Legionella birminghamensis TaxID=28083 RepID=A0A378I514_9GAMM|nr:ribosome biogenesis factor YjgA [Legionella birminghamensis]KTC68726.1 alpha helix protein [Legionella birminghamensis]STX30288.1 alpha helix protein [Legionella birminghamensis]